MNDQFADAFERLDALILNPASKAKELVAHFFGHESGFEAGLLNTLPGNEPFEVTPEDLFAVTMLSVNVFPRGVRRLLHE